MGFLYSEYTSAGLVRQNNQDSIFASVKDNCGLFIVADGMGGHFGGEIASGMLKTALSDWWGNFIEETGFKESCEQIKEIIEETNSVIYNQYSSQGKICGTTLALLFFYNDRYLLINTGDSRIYSYYRQKLRQESVDHVFSEEKKITGELTDDEIEIHRNKNKLTSAIGCKKNFKMNIKTAPLDRKTTFFLCSDGVYKLCDDKLIRRAVRTKDSAVMTELLKNNIEKNGAVDNFSFIRIDCTEKTKGELHMKSKLKIIIPIAIAVTAIILAVIFIQFKPNEAQLSDNPFELAQNYLVEQSYEQAIAEFEKAIALDPMNVEAYIGIAEAYEAIGNKDMAIEWLEKGFEATGNERLQEKLDEILNGDVEAAEVVTNVISETTSGGTTMVEVTYTKKQEYFDGSYCTFTYNEDKTLIKAEYFDQQGQFVTEKEYSKDDVESYQKRQLKEQLSKKERANTTIETAVGSKEVYDENGELKMNEYEYGVENYDNGNLVSSIMRVDDDNPANRGYNYNYYAYYNGFQYPEKEIYDRDKDSYDREAMYSFEFDEYGTPTKQYITWYLDNPYIEPERIEQCEFKNIYDDNGKLCCVITIINNGGHYYHSMDIVQKKNDTIIMDGRHSKSNNYIHIYIPNYDETGIVSELLIEKYICSCCEN